MYTHNTYKCCKSPDYVDWLHNAILLRLTASCFAWLSRCHRLPVFTTLDRVASADWLPSGSFAIVIIGHVEWQRQFPALACSGIFTDCWILLTRWRHAASLHLLYDFLLLLRLNFLAQSPVAVIFSSVIFRQFSLIIIPVVFNNILASALWSE